MVMPTLLELISREPEMRVEDVDEDSAEGEGGADAKAVGGMANPLTSMVVKMKGLGDKKISLNTSVIQDVQLAVQVKESILKLSGF